MAKRLEDMTDAELDAYLAQKTPGVKKTLDQMSDEELEALSNRSPRYGQAAVSGTRKGTEGAAGFAADASGLVQPIARKGSDILAKALRFAGIDAPGMDQQTQSEYKQGLFDEQPGEIIKNYIEPFGAEGLRQNVTNPIFGENKFKPRDKKEAYTESIFEAAPSAALGPTRIPAKIAQTFGGGVGAQAGEDLTKGTKAEPYGRLYGSLLGSGIMPGAFYGTKPTSSGNREYDDAVRLLSDEGVPLTAGQKLNSRSLRFAESELGGGTFDKFLQGQQDMFTANRMRDMGFPGRNATPENLVNARRQVGGSMDELARTTSVPFDQPLQDALLNVGSRYEQVAGNIAEGPRNTIYRLIDMATTGGGRIEGEAYQNIMTNIRELADSASGDTQVVLNQIRDAVDDAVARNMPPDQLPAWNRAREQYRGLSTIEKAMGGRGQAAAGFDISPGNLRSAISSEGPASIAEARNPLTNAANAGVQVMKDMPNSGTAIRAAVRGAPAAAAAAMSLGAGGPAAGAILAPYLAGKALMSGDVQRMLAPDERMRAFLAQMMAGSGGTARNR